VVVVIVVGRSCRITSKERGCVRVVEVVGVNVFKSCNDEKGWWGCVASEGFVIVMGLSGKVTMVIMTLLAF